MAYIETWKSDLHITAYDSKMFFPSFLLDGIYGILNEFRLIERFIPKNGRARLLEIGCATGELHRYFKRAFPRVAYTGADVSDVAVARAQEKYPDGDFVVTDFALSQVKDSAPDYLLARDVVLHQERPFEFLELLCSIPTKGLFVRLRTRDRGASVLDVEKSCQILSGTWIPFMILNCDELVERLRSLDRVARVVMVKNYMPLGGKHHRYLPKDCYLESTGTAETALYIELAPKPAPLQLIVEERSDDAPLPLLYRVSHKLAQRLIPRGYRARVWW
jgi:SAM-dependent methyltransferase